MSNTQATEHTHKHEEHAHCHTHSHTLSRSDGHEHIHSHRALIGFDKHGIPTIVAKADHQEDIDKDSDAFIKDYMAAVTEYKKTFPSKQDVIDQPPDPAVRELLLRAERRAIAEKYIDLVGLSQFQDSHPRQLSGGMQQRVSIARALATDPDIIFMDEPFGALDAITRMKLQDDILEISKQQQKTIIFVTHDIEEAVFLADRIVVMTPNPGKIKSIITVPLSRENRDRTSDDFIHWRDRVFEIFNMKHEPNIEYMI
ncbi:MAG: ABC transporter ATP-binding protein [Lachnospiraceae bacterium]|nr:ABC transporter ATP-binding protein [Lachnospiraceae bacterium]